MHAMATVSPYVQGTRILRTLGTGTYGRVVLARDPRPDGPERSVDLAMKYFTKGTTRKNILWEAAVLRKVAHAHAIRLFDVRASTPGGEEDPCDLPTLVFRQRAWTSRPSWTGGPMASCRPCWLAG